MPKPGVHGVLSISWACWVPRLSPEKSSRTQTPRICGERRRLRGWEHFSLLKDSLKAGDTCLLGAGRLMALRICFPGSSARTTASLLKGNRWTMVKALEGSCRSSRQGSGSLRLPVCQGWLLPGEALELRHLPPPATLIRGHLDLMW